MVKLHITEHSDCPEFIQSGEQKVGVQFRLFQEFEDIFIYRSDRIFVNSETQNIHQEIIEKHLQGA